MLNTDLENSENTSKYNLELFFDLSADFLVISGYDGYFKRVNPTATTLLGYTEEEMLSKPSIEFVHPDDRERTLQFRENLKKSIPVINFENRFIHKNGQEYWLSWSKIPYPEQQIIYGVAKNITFKKRLEQERVNVVSNLAGINNQLKQLNYTTTHDLRSPVNNMLTVMGFLDLEKIQDPATLKCIRIIKLAAEGLKDHLNSYVNQIKSNDYTKVDIQIISLSETLTSVTDSIVGLLKNANAKFNIDFSAFDMIPFNKSYLESILLNLITNSIKYASPQRFPEIVIRTDLTKNGHELIYSDNGIGFNMDIVKNQMFGLNNTFMIMTTAKV